MSLSRLPSRLPGGSKTVGDVSASEPDLVYRQDGTAKAQRGKHGAAVVLGALALTSGIVAVTDAATTREPHIGVGRLAIILTHGGFKLDTCSNGEYNSNSATSDNTQDNISNSTTPSIDQGNAQVDYVSLDETPLTDSSDYYANSIIIEQNNNRQYSEFERFNDDWLNRNIENRTTNVDVNPNNSNDMYINANASLGDVDEDITELSNPFPQATFDVNYTTRPQRLNTWLIYDENGDARTRNMHTLSRGGQLNFEAISPGLYQQGRDIEMIFRDWYNRGIGGNLNFDPNYGQEDPFNHDYDAPYSVPDPYERPDWSDLSDDDD
ncbi:hypothetical protein LAUMK191_00992 [Mycobacterium attenuatum]|nr:hypothetical protein LAUMK191_00992 [Mycobacterium attenuatum]